MAKEVTHKSSISAVAPLLGLVGNLHKRGPKLRKRSRAWGSCEEEKAATCYHGSSGSVFLLNKKHETKRVVCDVKALMVPLDGCFN